MAIGRDGWVVCSVLALGAAAPGLSGIQAREVGNPASAHTDVAPDAAATSAAVDTRGAWPRVHIPDPLAAQGLRAALDRAWTVLADPQCSRVLRDFSDQAGQSLESRLASVRVPVQQYLTQLVFIDDSRSRTCVTGIIGFTQPGSRVVRVCVDEFKRTWRQDQQHTVAALIHEMLHTLGLGENPPSPHEITKRVRSACGRR